MRACGIALACLALSGCSATSAIVGSSSLPPVAENEHLHISAAAEPTVLNQWSAQGAFWVTIGIDDPMFDPWVQLDDKGVWQPLVAEKVPTTKNGLVRTTPNGGMRIELPIRSNAAWSDGTALTCTDLVFTWKTLMNENFAAGNRFGWEHISNINCPSPHKAIINLRRPYSAYTSRILAVPPLPAHALKGKDFNREWNDKITVSNGPFVFREWKRGTRIVLERNPAYWRPLTPDTDGGVQRITFEFVRDSNTLKMQLMMRETQLALLPADTNLGEELKTIPDSDFSITAGSALEQLQMQTGKAPLNDERVRKAVAHAIDRQMIVDVALKGQVPVSNSAIIAADNALITDAYTAYDHNPKKVAQLLREAGYTRSGKWWTKKGKRLSLDYYASAASVPFRLRTGQLIQQQLRRQGIDMTITLLPSQVLYTQVAPKGAFDLGEWSEPVGSEPLLSVVYACSQIPKKPNWAGKNRMRYCDDEVDAMLADAESTAVGAQQREKMHVIDKRVAQDVPSLPLFRLPDTLAWTDELSGVKPNSLGGHLWNVETWQVSA